MEFKDRNYRLATAVALFGTACVGTVAVRDSQRTDQVDVSPLVVQAPVLDLPASFMHLDAREGTPKEMLQKWVKDGYSGEKWMIKSCTNREEWREESVLDTFLAKAKENLERDGKNVTGEDEARQAMQLMLVDCAEDLLKGNSNPRTKRDLKLMPLYKIDEKSKSVSLNEPEEWDFIIAGTVPCSGEKWNKEYTCPEWDMIGEGRRKVDLDCVDDDGKKVNPGQDDKHGSCKAKTFCYGRSWFCPADMRCDTRSDKCEKRRAPTHGPIVEHGPLIIVILIVVVVLAIAGCVFWRRRGSD